MMNNRVRTLMQLAYSVLMLPALAVTFRFYRPLFLKLVQPTTSGPFSGILEQEIWSLIFDLHDRKMDQEQFIAEVANRMKSAFLSGELDQYMDSADERNENLDITLKRCLGFLPLKWWYLKLHFMTPDNVHQLHSHRTVISAQVIIRGALDAEQYDVVRRKGDSEVHLKAIELPSGNDYQILVSTDKHCNVHGFKPQNGGAVRFQFYLRGHDTLLNRIPKRGRHYVEIKEGVGSDGLLVGVLGETGKAGES